MNDPFTCPKCLRVGCVPACGPKNSPILVVGEFPRREEIIKGRPMVGKMGDVLRAELGMLGVDINRLRLCNIWIHSPNGDKDCYEYGLQEVIREAKNRKAILLLGSETVKSLCELSVSKVCGLRVTSRYLSAPILYACVNPAVAFHGGIGEVRLALKKFVLATGDLL